MPKKKQTRNGLYWFMQEIMPQLKREGYSFPGGMADVVPLALPRWKILPATERERYDRKAKEEKAKARGQPAQDLNKFRMDNVGNIIADRVDPIEELRKRREREKKYAFSRFPKDTDEFMLYKFYFISFEYLCKIEEEEYPPVEMGMVEYSLQNGISKVFHKFINPGKIPLGYRFNCQQHSEDHHQIPIENFNRADDNYMGIWIQMENFVNPNNDRREYPPVYCITDDAYPVTDYCMDWLYSRACTSGPTRLEKVFNLTDLIRNISEYNGEFIVQDSGAINILATTAWDYENDTRCDFHEEIDVKHCALYTCKKAAYAISDWASNIFNFTLTPYHMPQTISKPTATVIAPSSIQLSKPTPVRKSRGYGYSSERSGPFAARDFRITGDQPVLRGQPAGMNAPTADSDEDNNSIVQPQLSMTARKPHPPDFGKYPTKKPPSTTDLEEYPSLGASIDKFAGRAAPPPPSEVPKPAYWQQEQEEDSASPPRSESPEGPPMYSFGGSVEKSTGPKKTLRQAVEERKIEDLQQGNKVVNTNNPWGIPAARAPVPTAAVRGPRPSLPAGPRAWGGGRGAQRNTPPAPNPSNPWGIQESPSQSPSIPAVNNVTQFSEPSTLKSAYPQNIQSYREEMPITGSPPLRQNLTNGVASPNRPLGRGTAKPPTPAASPSVVQAPSAPGVPPRQATPITGMPPGLGRGVRQFYAPSSQAESFAKQQLSAMYSGVGRGRGRGMSKNTPDPTPGLGKGVIGDFTGMNIEN